MLEASHLVAFGTLLSDAQVAASQDGMSQSAVAVLLALLHHKSMTATALSKILGVSQPTAARVTGGLIKSSLIAKSTRDGREVGLSLTAKGKRTASKLQAQRLQVVESLLVHLNHEERSTLDALVSRLLADSTSSREAARRICRFCDHGICVGANCPVGWRAREIETMFRS